MKALKISDWRLWVGSFAAWTAFSLLFGLSNYAWHLSAGHSISAYDAFWLHLLNCWIDAFLTPFVLVVSSRYTIDKANWKRSLAIHLAGMIVFTLIHMTIRMMVYPVRDQFSNEIVHPSLDLLWRMAIYGLHAEGVTAYLSVVIVAQVVYFKTEAQKTALAVEQMRRFAAETRLETLKLQLQPHFLFNSLNAAAELIHSEPDTAERMLFSIADMLRDIVSEMPSVVHTIAQELDFTSTFFSIEQIRFAGRLKLETKIAPELYDCVIPTMLLQPLVENAVKHGMSQGTCELKISIEVASVGANLEIIVRDNGRGLSRDSLSARRSGTGLQNTQERLLHLYPENHEFVISNQVTGGTIVRIALPRCRVSTPTMQLS